MKYASTNYTKYCLSAAWKNIAVDLLMKTRWHLVVNTNL